MSEIYIAPGGNDNHDGSSWASARLSPPENLEVGSRLRIADGSQCAGERGMNDVRFNVNNHVRVRLTDRGIAELRRQHEETRALFATIGPFVPPNTDADGYARFQLWELMSQFGPITSFGGALPFETEIIIELPDAAVR